MLAPVTIKKPISSPPNPQATAALAKHPTLTTTTHLQTIKATLNATPVVVPTLVEYVMAPSIPTMIHAPTQTPSAFVPPPATILLAPPPQINTAEFINLICHAISENATGIPNINQLATTFKHDGTNIPLLISSLGLL